MLDTKLEVASQILHSIIHVPRQGQFKFVPDIASGLRPGGLLMAALGARSMKDDFLGWPVFLSRFDSQTHQRFVEEAGLRIVGAREETVEEHGQPVMSLWVIAQKPIGADDGGSS